MDLEDFKEYVIINDVSFKYKNKEYFIFLFEKSFTVGEYGSDKHTIFGESDDLYDNMNDMLNKWMFGQKALKDIVNDIEVE